MNIYTGLLFQHGYIQDPKLALSLAGEGAHRDAAPQRGDRAAGSPKAAKKDANCKPYRRGGIASVCSVALSPFR